MPPAPEDDPSQSEIKSEAKGEDEQEDGSWVKADMLQCLPEGAELTSVDVQRAVGHGENFLSILYRTRVEYLPAGAREPVIKHLVVKGLPPGEYMTKFVEEAGFFRRETAIYEEVFPEFYAFADARLRDKSFPRFSPASHKAPRPDTLIMDDLRPLGFEMADRRKRLDLAHCTLVVQYIARLHALSLAYTEEHPGYLKQFPDIMYSERNKSRLIEYIKPLVKSIAEEVAEWGGLDTIKTKLESLENNVMDRLIEISTPTEGCRTVLSHGDCWINNILFKYSDSGEPVELRFVDYQLTCEASPGLELNYFLFSSPTTEVRVHHLEDILREYCDEFRRCARDLGFRGPLITLDEIRHEVKRTLFFGFISALSTLPIVLANAGDAPDLSSFTLVQVEKEEGINIYDKVFKNVIFIEDFKILLKYFDENGILD